MTKDPNLVPLTDRPATRASFLRKAGIGGAALVGGGVLLGASAGTARAGHDNPAAITDVGCPELRVDAGVP